MAICRDLAAACAASSAHRATSASATPATSTPARVDASVPRPLWIARLQILVWLHFRASQVRAANTPRPTRDLRAAPQLTRARFPAHATVSATACPAFRSLIVAFPMHSALVTTARLPPVCRTLVRCPCPPAMRSCVSPRMPARQRCATQGRVLVFGRIRCARHRTCAICLEPAIQQAESARTHRSPVGLALAPPSVAPSVLTRLPTRETVVAAASCARAASPAWLEPAEGRDTFGGASLMRLALRFPAYSSVPGRFQA